MGLGKGISARGPGQVGANKRVILKGISRRELQLLVEIAVLKALKAQQGDK